MSALLGHRGLLLRGGLWSPAQLTVPPKLWYDDQSPVTAASGFASQWNDRGSIRANLSSPSGSRPQIIAAGLNGLRYLRFDGIDDYLNSTNVNALDVMRNVAVGWMFSVFLQRSGSNIVTFTRDSSSASRFAMLARSTPSNEFVVGARRLDGGTFVNAVATGPGVGVWQMGMAVADYSGGIVSATCNGNVPVSSAIDSGVSANTRSGAFTVGRFNATSSTIADCDIAALLIGSGSSPSAGEIDKLFGWAAWRYGLVSSLPPGHPYKSSPP